MGFESLGAELGREFIRQDLYGHYDEIYPTQWAERVYWIIENLPYFLLVYRTIRDYTTKWQKKVEFYRNQIKYYQDQLDDLKDIEAQARQTGPPLSADKRLKLKEFQTQYQNEVDRAEDKIENPPPIMMQGEPLPIHEGTLYVIENLENIARIDQLATKYFNTRKYCVSKIMSLGTRPIEKILASLHRKEKDEDMRKEYKDVLKSFESYCDKFAARF